MKALSIRQPWASQIIAGEKTIEWRAVPIRYRGIIAIHAAREPQHPTLPTGVILGEVDVIACVHRPHETPYPRWPWAWHLANPAEWDHVAAVGNVGLWNADAGIRRAQELAAAPDLFAWVTF